MATEQEFEPMDQDGDDDGATLLQVEVTNDLFKNNNEDLLDFEADDLEITEFLKTEEQQDKTKNNVKQVDSKTSKSVDCPDSRNRIDSPAENITISVSAPNDDGNESAKEDGEISETQSQSDDDNTQYFSRSSSVRSSRRRNDIRRERSPVARRYPNPYLEFDDKKIQSRAVRFGLANSSSATAPTEKEAQIADEDLLNLYISCGLIQDDGGKLTLDKVAPHHRLDSILIRGTNHMNTTEIFKYLYDLGQKPVAMEWVNDAMCVVIYDNQYDAATSLLKTSKPILMDPRLAERKRSIMQSSENEKEDKGEEKSENMNEDIEYDKVDAIPQSWITVPMPPGYVWRFGAPCEKAKGILVRYANKNDKKQERAERFSEFYQKYGNPNKVVNNRENSGTSENVRRRKKIRSEHGTYETDRKEKEGATFRESQIKSANPNDKNGWGQLSAMWDDEEAFQRSARDRLTTVRQRTKDSDTVPSGISPMKRPEAAQDGSPSSKNVDARDLLKSRQKRKRGTNSSDEEGEESDSDTGDNDERFGLNDWKDGSHRRKRNSKVNDEDDDDGDNIAWKERLSGPRMRMHADEEEERMKRRAFRRLGHKRGSGGGDAGLQTNSWDFSRDSSGHTSFRSKTQTRRPISERLGAKRTTHQGVTHHDNRRDDNVEGLNNQGGFDLRQKLINMRRTGNDEASTDEEEDLHNLIFYGND